MSACWAFPGPSYVLISGRLKFIGMVVRMTSPATEQFSVRMPRALRRRMLADANGMSFHAPIIPYWYTMENYQSWQTIITR